MAASGALRCLWQQCKALLRYSRCSGGIFGALANLLAAVLIWAITLAVKSRKLAIWQDGLKPLGIAALFGIQIATMEPDVRFEPKPAELADRSIRPDGREAEVRCISSLKGFLA